MGRFEFPDYNEVFGPLFSRFNGVYLAAAGVVLAACIAGLDIVTSRDERVDSIEAKRTRRARARAYFPRVEDPRANYRVSGRDIAQSDRDYAEILEIVIATKEIEWQSYNADHQHPELEGFDE